MNYVRPNRTRDSGKYCFLEKMQAHALFDQETLCPKAVGSEIYNKNK